MVSQYTISLLALLPLTTTSFGFSTSKVLINPVIQEYVKDAEKETCFEIKIVAGDPLKHESKLPINGLMVNLEESEPEKDKRISMPGANGPHPQLSTGIRSLNVLKNAGFIDMSGIQKIELSNGCWEMGWRNEHPAGALICGFHNVQTVKRHDASLPSGRIYISFPLWTAESLVTEQARKKEAKEVLSKYEREKDDAMAKMSETHNPLMKALHYRSAFAAAEKMAISSQYNSMIEQVPEDSDVIPIGHDLLMCTKGTVWTKKDGFFGGDHILLGYAIAGLTTDPSLEP
eukprot:CAMPEP_0172482140 /NCGR_PEP_ID=MMETSP1066-20121228/8396_1 /TAXON_ID=671091 /ORGANISM="Coscinodiscus wailesii, Strain CCMP2513" /LENGTH=287 /DNA_ID=CAMNT_0013245043 /DNA_START=78 /DNA_END=941 /DNA_ORIENTATION=+